MLSLSIWLAVSKCTIKWVFFHATSPALIWSRWISCVSTLETSKGSILFHLPWLCLHAGLHPLELESVSRFHNHSSCYQLLTLQFSFLTHLFFQKNKPSHISLKVMDIIFPFPIVPNLENKVFHNLISCKLLSLIYPPLSYQNLIFLPSRALIVSETHCVLEHSAILHLFFPVWNNLFPIFLFSFAPSLLFFFLLSLLSYLSPFLSFFPQLMLKS